MYIGGDFIIEYIPDALSTKALRLLYNEPNGLRFNELNIDESSCILMYENGYIYMPPNSVVDTIWGKKRRYDGDIIITSRGREYVENLNKEASREKRNNNRFWCNTIITILTLIVSCLLLLWQVFIWCKTQKSTSQFESSSPSLISEVEVTTDIQTNNNISLKYSY